MFDREVQQLKAEKALRVFLQDQKFVEALCMNYNSMKQGTGQKKIVPDGEGAWIADIRHLRSQPLRHDLGIVIPSITIEQFRAINYAKRSPEAEAIVQQMRDQVLANWSCISWLAGGISNLFMQSPRQSF